jgi:hypothetical protein
MKKLDFDSLEKKAINVAALGSTIGAALCAIGIFGLLIYNFILR